MNNKNGKKITLEMLYGLFPDASDADVLLIFEALESADFMPRGEEEYWMECSMCGKEISYRYCGMCTHCEMVWNG